MTQRILVMAVLAFVSLVRPAASAPAAEERFDYYLLVLSYAPDFCAQPTGNKDPRECGAGRRLGFIVHGLWPQAENGRGPENCGNARPVSAAIIQATLQYIPVDSLIQHEWRSHGTCTGMTAAAYFTALRKARDSVKLPDDINQPAKELQLAPAEVESKIAAANPTFPKTAFRTTCYRDNELQEIRIGLTKDLSPRACSASAGSCPAKQITLLPVR